MRELSTANGGKKKMQPKADGFQNLWPPAQGSAIDQAGSVSVGANVIYPEEFTGRGSADVTAPAPLSAGYAEPTDAPPRHRLSR